MTIDPTDDARRLLHQVDVLRHPSDLDLLIFFARHPRAMLSTDQLGAFLGYGAKEIAASLDLLLEAGLLTRAANSRHAARLYVFGVGTPDGGWLPSLLQFASTRKGRLALVAALRERSSTDSDVPADHVDRTRSAPGDPLRFPTARQPPKNAARR